MDVAPALYLGRPCYHGLANDKGCTPLVWTHERYGSAVVESLLAALERRVGRERPLVLIGHSGGGALALLLAVRLQNACGVVTLAGNLDLAGWTELHGYAPLRGSLDPLAARPLPASQFQLHYAGSEDRQIPATLIARAALTLGGTARVLPAVGHTEGWLQVWPSLLAEIARAEKAHCRPRAGREEEVSPVEMKKNSPPR